MDIGNQSSPMIKAGLPKIDKIVAILKLIHSLPSTSTSIKDKIDKIFKDVTEAKKLEKDGDKEKAVDIYTECLSSALFIIEKKGRMS